MNPLDRLQEWYLNECNGDWEHSYGVKIDTLDNPGWILTVDLSETAWEGLNIERVILRRTDSDWIQYEAVNSQFKACGGPSNLNEILEKFLNVVSI